MAAVSEPRVLASARVGGASRVPALFFGSTILLSAFLLFQVQPLIAKLILPWFGGSAAVWTTCLVFFELTLLLGYTYAHWLSRRKTVTQRTVHLSLLGLSCFWLPILPSAAWKSNSVEDPVLRIVGLLGATIGLPFLVLSATTPLLQAWYSRSNGNAMPYRYFALSNAGSLIGLLTYPVLVEPYLANHQQAWTWSMSYCAFVVLCGAIAWRTCSAPVETSAAPVVKAAVPHFADRFLWLTLAACPSALLLAVTHHLTENIAACSVPLGPAAWSLLAQFLSVLRQ